MRFDFTGRNVIVTGGTRGIGLAVTKAFLGAGASVVATYVGDEKAATVLAEDESDKPLTLERFDVSNYREVEAFYERFDVVHDRLDALVNNAGVRRDAVVGMMSEEDWRMVVDINLTSVYNMSKFAVMRMMGERFGRIVNVTSPSGKHGFPGQANYAAAKAGMVAFSKSLANETGKRGITVNCVSPGFIQTDLIADLTAEQVKEYKAKVPLKRFGRPEEIAQAILFLCDPESAYVTGTTLEVTGGL